MKKILFILLLLCPLWVAAQKTPSSVVAEYIKILNKYCENGYRDEDVFDDIMTPIINNVSYSCEVQTELSDKMRNLCGKYGISCSDPTVYAGRIDYRLYVNCFFKLKIRRVDLVGSMKEKKEYGSTIVTATIKYSGGILDGFTTVNDYRIEGNAIYSIYANQIAIDALGSITQKTQSGSGSSGSHQYVDLGLPSGTLWATCNVGANNEWEYGDYFAWGETSPKSIYNCSTYKYANGDYNKLTKYCSKNDYGNNGFTDSRTILEKSDDAATANWGSDWRMPTAGELYALRNKCYWVWTSNYKGHKCNGYIVYKALKESDEGKKIFKWSVPDAAYSERVAHIFLPAAGRWWENKPSDVGSNCSFWSSSLVTVSPNGAGILGFDSNLVFDLSADRCLGLSVRPVRCKN